jgi:hypothetical protein
MVWFYSNYDEDDDVVAVVDAAVCCHSLYPLC